MIEAVKKPREVSYAVETTGINESMGIGERNEITVKLLKYSYYDDSEEAVCEVVPDAHFKWGYDPHSIEIRDANGNVVGNTDEYGEYQDSEYSSGASAPLRSSASQGMRVIFPYRLNIRTVLLITMVST